MVPAVLFAASLVDQRRAGLAAAGERRARSPRAHAATVAALAERVAARFRPAATAVGACATC